MYIYCAISPSGKRYVGQTRRDVEQRWKEHLDDARDPNKDRCKALNHAIRKYGGDAFRVFRIACCLPWLLDEYEQDLIVHHRCSVPHGYNIKLGGSSGSHHEETKAKIRAKLRGKTFSRDTLARRGVSKKREKDLPMFVCGWYKAGVLRGIRVCNHPALKERRFSLGTHGDIETCKKMALDYVSGSRFND